MDNSYRETMTKPEMLERIARGDCSEVQCIRCPWSDVRTGPCFPHGTSALSLEARNWALEQLPKAPRKLSARELKMKPKDRARLWLTTHAWSRYEDIWLAGYRSGRAERE